MHDASSQRLKTQSTASAERGRCADMPGSEHQSHGAAATGTAEQSCGAGQCAGLALALLACDLTQTVASGVQYVLRYRSALQSEVRGTDCLTCLLPEHSAGGREHFQCSDSHLHRSSFEVKGWKREPLKGGERRERGSEAGGRLRAHDACDLPTNTAASSSSHCNSSWRRVPASRTGLQVGIASALYGKVLRLSQAARLARGQGAIMNLASNDVDQLCW